MPEWRIYNSGPGEPAENMAIDEALLERAADFRAPVLRLYSWKRPAATFGYFQRYGDVAAAIELRPLLRRPTGGGIVPHARDWTYSLVFPPEHEWHRLHARESYRRVHAWVAEALKGVGLAAALASTRVEGVAGKCFAGAEQFDVLLQDCKIAGAAQRRNRFGLLVQGSIQPSGDWSRPGWEQEMCRYAEQEWGVQWATFITSSELTKHIERLVQTKYATSEYNQRR